MNIDSPNVTNLSGITAYLEGIKIPFSNVQISEAEGSIPSAVITFVADSNLLRILTGTTLQIYGDASTEDGNSTTNVLLFEGDLTGINYVKDANMGNQISLTFTHLFSKMLSARLLPSDALITVQKGLADGLQKTQVAILKDTAVDKLYQPDQTSNDLQTSTVTPAPAPGPLATLGAMTRLGDLADKFANLLGQDKIMAGNYQPIIDSFNQVFEQNDIIYGVMSK